ncbi:MAG TPA: porphobilinogen synthase [Verrucomicrobiae bacterium]|nr:porphobilinogen synthase [Verrucomicrobiae bacterium]
MPQAKTSSQPRKTVVRLTQRPRRNRTSEGLRRLVRETRLSPSDFVLPLFVMEGREEKSPVLSMPGVCRWTRDLLVKKAREAAKLGIPAVALFPCLGENRKDKTAAESVNPDGLLQTTVRALKDAVPEIVVITDVAMDPYSTDGHDGLVAGGKILNDETLEILAAMAVSQAEAGADLVAPSDMMDGRVAFIREALDKAGRKETGILSYAVKYASAFYGPFRDALDSAPRSGDKKTYQMDPANVREALREAQLDVSEGADIIMVKPALAYLDVIAKVKETAKVPVAAYQVSGEYAMIKAAAEKGWADEEKAMEETLLSIKRAGADIIFTYFAEAMAKKLGA